MGANPRGVTQEVTALPEKSHKCSDRKAFRSFDSERSVLGGREALLIYTSLGCGGVGGSVDRIAEHVGDRLMVMVCLRVCLPH